MNRTIPVNNDQNKKKNKKCEKNETKENQMGFFFFFKMIQTVWAKRSLFRSSKIQGVARITLMYAR